MNHYPPMKALLAFEASVRLGSFLKAAQELNVTPGAISQQVKKLEAQLDVPLFVREIRKLTVTEAGLRYYHLITPALGQIKQAGELITQQAQRHLTLSMPPSFAAKWFSGRMTEFMAKFSDIDLRINATSALIALEKDDVDLAIRYAPLTQEPLPERWLLCADTCSVYGHPDYLAAHQLQQPDDITNCTLLHTTLHPYWSAWLHAHTTLSQTQIEALPAIHFDHTALAIDAAKNRQGLIITSPLLLQQELHHGELALAFPQPYHTGKGVYLLIHRQRQQSKRLQEIVRWIRQQFALATQSTEIIR